MINLRWHNVGNPRRAAFVAATGFPANHDPRQRPFTAAGQVFGFGSSTTSVQFRFVFGRRSKEVGPPSTKEKVRCRLADFDHPPPAGQATKPPPSTLDSFPRADRHPVGRRRYLALSTRDPARPRSVGGSTRGVRLLAAYVKGRPRGRQSWRRRGETSITTAPPPRDSPRVLAFVFLVESFVITGLVGPPAAASGG